MNTIRRIPEYKPIPNTNEQYWVSDTGIVESRRYGKVRIMKFSVVRKRKEDKGHLRLTYWDKDKVRQRVQVHVLVGLLFIPNPNNYPQINHKDGDKHNNFKDNLEWSTQAMNMHHAYHVLGHQQIQKADRSGQKNPAAKLTQQKVNKIREQYNKGNITQKELSKQFRVGRITINKIINNKSWAQ